MVKNNSTGNRWCIAKNLRKQNANNATTIDKMWVIKGSQNIMIWIEWSLLFSSLLVSFCLLVFVYFLSTCPQKRLWLRSAQFDISSKGLHIHHS